MERVRDKGSTACSKGHTHASRGKSGSIKTVRKQHTYTMWCAIGHSVAGRLESMRYFFTRSIDRSTCILTDAMRLVCASSLGSNCSLPSKNAGILRVTPSGRRSSMRNPQSAMTLSPASSNCTSPERLTISLSEIRPPYSSDTNDGVPLGVTPSKNLNVL